MSRHITSPDRRALIRLAGALEKGSEERRAILGGLKKAFNEPDSYYDLEEGWEQVHEDTSRKTWWWDRRQTLLFCDSSSHRRVQFFVYPDPVRSFSKAREIAEASAEEGDSWDWDDGEND